MNNHKKRRVTVRDIADELGLSHPTVSRALNDHPRISEETKIKVREMAKKLNYRPNIMARGLTSHRTSLIGLVIRDIRSSFHADIIAGVQDVLDKHGYSILLCSSSMDVQNEKRHLQTVSDKQVEGIIVVPVLGDNSNSKLIERIHDDGTPVVLVSLGKQLNKIPCVKVDNILGGYMATKHFLEMGHKEVKYYTYEHPAMNNLIPGVDENIDRYAGYVKAMREAGLTEKIGLVIDPDFGMNPHFINDFMKKKNIPRALFSFSDEMAMCFMRTIIASGKRIPEDMSIIGFDDIPCVSMMYPGLTTIAQPKYELGSLAAEQLLSMISGKEVEMEVVLNPEIVCRNSVNKLT